MVCHYSFNVFRRIVLFPFRFLCTGLWPEALIVLFNLRLQLEISETRLDAVLDSMSWRVNRYGLFKPEDVVAIMSEATVEGKNGND